MHPRVGVNTTYIIVDMAITRCLLTDSGALVCFLWLSVTQRVRWLSFSVRCDVRRCQSGIVARKQVFDKRWQLCKMGQ